MPELETTLNTIAQGNDSGPEQLVALVDALRPAGTDAAGAAHARFTEFCERLEADPALRQGLRDYLLRTIGARKQSHLYSDTGIFDGTGFFTELRQRMGWKLLPPALNDDHFRDVFGATFHEATDGDWISSLDDALWLRLVAALEATPPPLPDMARHPVHEALESLSTLSHRLTALGLDLHLVRVYPEIESYESPFLALSAEIDVYTRAYREQLADHRSEREDARQALVLMAQCRDMLTRIRKRSPETGISIRLTQLLVRMQQTLRRMETLLGLLESTGPDLRQQAVTFFKELVRADNRKYSLREVLATHTSLLALRVTENAGHTGEHYVTTSRRDYFAMLRSGLGAGFIVGFMALLKMLAGKLSLAPVGAAFVYSLNYSLGFMLVHMLHFTIATKQPAMTAARIAASIQDVDSGRERELKTLAALCVNVFRTQFIAIMGNVLLALPTAILLAWLWRAGTGAHLVDPAKVAHLLHELDPFSSLALFHAAIAGVCLFLAGLISGYYDNKAVYTRIPDRLRQRRTLRRLLGEERLERFATYVGDNLGALAGNFYFGIMLGSMGSLGVILGLPLDIRHITFSSAYLGIALVGGDLALPVDTLLISLGGVLAIGFINLVVSFGLALLVALRARNVTYRQWLPLLGMILRSFLQQPRSFFWPPREAPVTAIATGPAPKIADEKKAAS